MRAFLTIIFFLASGGCGVIESEYVKYEDAEAAKDGGGESAVCEPALNAFKADIAPLIKDCKACHAAGAPNAAQITFTDDDNNNRKILRAKKGGSADSLFTFLRSSTHPGNTLVSAGDETKFTGWFEAEKSCPEGSDGLQ